MRTVIEVGTAVPDDLDGLAALCLTARRESSVGSQVCSPDADVVAQQIGTLTAVPGGKVLVARCDGAVVGLLLGRLLGPNPFTDGVSLAVEVLYVDPSCRRRGAGHALMKEAAAVATAAGAEQVYAAPIPGARGMQRFFVQLGFTPAAAHRVTSTSALQRRLDAAATRRPGARGLEDLIARRRQSRAETTGPVPVVPPADQSRRGSISKHVKRAVHTRRDVESSTTIS